MSSVLSQFHHRIYGPAEAGSSEEQSAEMRSAETRLTQLSRWVFLHGLMGFMNNWRTIIAGLEKTEQCLAYDQRGHGRSIKPDHGYSSDDYANDLKAILDELGWQKITLVGHSMGGRNALNFTSRFPERVERLVIEDIGPEASGDNLAYYEKLLGLVPTPFEDRAQAREFFSGEFLERAKTRDNPKMLAEYFYANMEEKEDRSVSWRFSKEAVLESVREGQVRARWDEVEALQVPTLLIRGERSKELSPEIFTKMLETNKLIQGVTIKDAGHWVHADQPESFLEAIREFTRERF